MQDAFRRDKFAGDNIRSPRLANPAEDRVRHAGHRSQKQWEIRGHQLSMVRSGTFCPRKDFSWQPNRLDALADGLLGAVNVVFEKISSRSAFGWEAVASHSISRSLAFGGAPAARWGELSLLELPHVFQPRRRIVYFVVRTGEGETLPYATSFRSRSSFVPKALKAEVRSSKRRA